MLQQKQTIGKNKGQARVCLWNKVMNKCGFAIGQRIHITSNPDGILVVPDESGKRKVSRVKNHGNILPVIDLKQTKTLDLSPLGRIGDSVVVTFEQNQITIRPTNVATTTADHKSAPDDLLLTAQDLSSIESDTTWYVKVLTNTDRGGDKKRSGNSGVNISKYAADLFPQTLPDPTPEKPAPGLPIDLIYHDMVLNCRFQGQSRGGKRKPEPRITGDGFAKIVKHDAKSGDLCLIRCSAPHRLTFLHIGTPTFLEAVKLLTWQRGGSPVDFGTETKGTYALASDYEIARIRARQDVTEAPFEESTVTEELFADPSENESSTEGKRTKVFGIRVERSKKARDQCLQHWGYSCQVCGLNFQQRYGSIGRNFIHVHHLDPIALTGETKTDPVNDLRPVCPNCHSMLHKKYPPYEIDELKNMIKH